MEGKLQLGKYRHFKGGDVALVSLNSDYNFLSALALCSFVEILEHERHRHIAKVKGCNSLKLHRLCYLSL